MFVHPQTPGQTLSPSSALGKELQTPLQHHSKRDLFVNASRCRFGICSLMMCQIITACDTPLQTASCNTLSWKAAAAAPVFCMAQGEGFQAEGSIFACSPCLPFWLTWLQNAEDGGIGHDSGIQRCLLQKRDELLRDSSDASASRVSPSLPFFQRSLHEDVVLSPKAFHLLLLFSCLNSEFSARALRASASCCCCDPPLQQSRLGRGNGRRWEPALPRNSLMETRLFRTLMFSSSSKQRPQYFQIILSRGGARKSCEYSKELSRLPLRQLSSQENIC